MIYVQNFNISLKKIETIHCNTGTLRGSSRVKQYQELGLDSSTTTLVLKTLLFLQNTKITVSKVPFFIYSDIKYFLQRKAI